MTANIDKTRIKNRTKRTLEGYAFITPMFLLLAVFTLYPMVFSFFVSFTDWNFLTGFEKFNFVGLKNYTAMFKDIWFTDSLKNTVVYTIMYVPVTIILSALLAVLLNEYVFLQKGLRLCYFIPYISNVAASSILWKSLYSPTGIIARFFGRFGIEVPVFLADVKWAMPAIVLMSIWSAAGYCSLIYVAAMQGVSQDIYESAKLDGCSGLKMIINITMPLVRKTTFFLVITQMINSFKVFGQIQIMTKGGPIRATSVLAYYIYQSAFKDYKFGYASAMAIVLFFIILIITLFQWKFQSKYDY